MFHTALPYCHELYNAMYGGEHHPTAPAWCKGVPLSHLSHRPFGYITSTKLRKRLFPASALTHRQIMIPGPTVRTQGIYGQWTPDLPQHYVGLRSKQFVA